MMEAAFGRLQKGGLAVFGSWPTFSETIVGEVGYFHPSRQHGQLVSMMDDYIQVGFAQSAALKKLASSRRLH